MFDCLARCISAYLIAVSAVAVANAQFANDDSASPIHSCDDYQGLCDEGCDAIGVCRHKGICSRQTLTGDWGGLRTCLQEQGVTFAGRVTQFGFGVDGGINTAAAPAPLSPGDTFKYTGRGEYDFLFDLEKFGGLPMGRLLMRWEHWYGEFANVSTSTGAFAPAVFPAALPPRPNDPGALYMTNFLFTQPLSENFVVFAGKKDVLGAADQTIFAGGDGTKQFVNQALIANPAFLLALPYTGFTVGFVSPQEWGAFSAFVYDPKDRTANFFNLDDLFAAGVIVGGEVKLNTDFFDLPGEQHVGAIWKHVDLPDLEFSVNPPGEYPYDDDPTLVTKRDSYTIYYGFDQYIKQYNGARPSALPNKNPRGWGIFGRASISDANPTPIQYFLSLGVGGNSPMNNHNDNWGVGWYYVGVSNEFGPAPEALIGPRDGTGVEVFYNRQITPWLNLTPDVQYVRPGGGAIADDSFIYGIRLGATL
ncbi:MAG: carbohydrate porin [Planctomycetota bacterium]